jgi:hypothetical protein
MSNLKESLNKSFDKARLSFAEGPRTNGKSLIPFVVSLSKGHERNQLNQMLPKESQ